MKKFLIFFIILFLFFLVLWFIPSKHHTTKGKRVQKSNIVSTSTHKKHSQKKKRISVKKVDFVHVDFQRRLLVLHAKLGDPVFIRIFKKEALLEVWIKPTDKDTYELFKRYPICAYSGKLGPKTKEGDGQSPEGFYKVSKSSLNPNSHYYLAFNLGYPNAYDKAHNRTGSYLMVHGKCNSVGCYAMTDRKIKEIYSLVASALNHGQNYVNVHAFPFYMTQKNMARYEQSRWYDFWSELKEGYDYFNIERLPPEIRVENGHYSIYEANQ